MLKVIVGNVRDKRRYIARYYADSLIIDSDEVLLDFRMDDREYAVIGHNPFATMTVDEYIKYSLASRHSASYTLAKSLITSLGIRVNHSIKSLSIIEYRAVVLATRRDATCTKVILNLDTVISTLSSKRLLRRLLLRLGECDITLSVSDMRLLEGITHFVTQISSPPVSTFSVSTKAVTQLLWERRLSFHLLDSPRQILCYC